MVQCHTFALQLTAVGAHLGSIEWREDDDEPPAEFLRSTCIRGGKGTEVREEGERVCVRVCGCLPLLAYLHPPATILPLELAVTTIAAPMVSVRVRRRASSRCRRLLAERPRRARALSREQLLNLRLRI